MGVVLEECYVGRIPPMFWGPPGVGKSECIRNFSKNKGIGCIDIRLSQYDPVDLRGVPRVETLIQRIEALEKSIEISKRLKLNDKIKPLEIMIENTMEALCRRGNTIVTQWAAPSFLPMPERDGEKGILFLDEITSADGQVQAAAYQLVLDRRLGDYELPEGWLVVAAGNRPEDRAVVKDMSSALANRFCHFEVEYNLNDWVEWAFKAKIDSRVISYHRHKEGSSLYKFDPSSNDKAFPTPRTWERVSDVLKSQNGVIPTDTIHGCVGIGEGVEFEAFCDLRNYIPDPDAILAAACRGERVNLPDLDQKIKMKKKKRVREDDGGIVVKDVEYDFDGSCLMYLLLTAIAMKTCEDNVAGIWNIIDQLAGENFHKDYAIWFLTDCLAQDRKLISGFESGKRLRAFSKDNTDLVSSMRHAAKN
jgi:hypothetical protein